MAVGSSNSESKISESTAPKKEKSPKSSEQQPRFFLADFQLPTPVNIAKIAPQPISVMQRNWREEWPHLLMVFLFAFGLYALTTPRVVALEDDGLFLMNMHYFGVAHPPGYPLYTILGGIFYHLFPFGTPAFKGHLFSGFAAAVACSALYASAILLTRGRVFGYLAGMSYAASMTFWSQAIIAEVYTLNSMMFFITLALCIMYASHRGDHRDKFHFRLFCAIAFVYCLGVTNHIPLIGLAGLGLGVLVFSQIRNIIRRVPYGAIFALLAMFPYLFMYWRSHSGSISTFYGPIENWDQFLFYILRKGYVGVDNQEHVGLADKIAFIKFLSNKMLWEFTPAGLAFVVIGFVSMLFSRYVWVALALFITWFTGSFLLIGLIDFKAEFIWFSAFRVYPLIPYGVMALWLAVGAAWCVDRIPKISIDARKIVGVGAIVLVVGSSIAVHSKVNNRKDYRWAHDFATFKLNSLEPGASFFSFDDLDVPVMYLRYVENVRPDTTVYNDQGLVLGNRLFPPLVPDHPIPNNPTIVSKYNIIQKYINEKITNTPIYYHPNRTELYRNDKYGSDFMGFFPAGE